MKDQIPPVSPQAEIIRNRWEEILVNVGRGFSVGEIAAAMKISRRVLFKYLNKLGVSVEEVRTAYREYQQEIERKRSEKITKLTAAMQAAPASWELFLQDPVIQDYMRKKKAQGITHEHILSTLKTVFRVARDLNVHPARFTKELVEEWITEYLSDLGELLRDPAIAQKISGEIISPLREWGNYIGYRIMYKTIKYQGQWNVYFTRDERARILEIAKQLFPDKAEWIEAMLKYYFYTGSRASAIDFEVIEQHKRYVLVKTEEKGKRTKLIWEKVIPGQEWPLISKYLPFKGSEYEKQKTLKQLRKLLIKIYMQLFSLSDDDVRRIKNARLIPNNGEPDLRQIVKEYGRKAVYAIRHPLHIWRHTAAMTLLYATGWNYGLVSKALGWKNPEILMRVYGEMPRTALLEELGYLDKKEREEFTF